MEEFAKGDQSLWRFNCLVYAGAVAVSNMVKKPWAAPRKQQVNPRKEVDIAKLCRTIGWLKCEICRIKRGDKMTARQHKNLKEMKMEHKSLRELEMSLKTQKACLRVSVTQIRRLRANAKSKASNTAYRRLGVASLCSKPCQGEGIRPSPAEDVDSYWKALIGVEGHFDLEDPAIYKDQ